MFWHPTGKDRIKPVLEKNKRYRWLYFFYHPVLLQHYPLSRGMMTEEDRQKMSGSMTYPQKGTLNRFLFKIPLIWWRMGLGPILSHNALAGNKMLVLTSWGRRSHKPRHTMLSYVRVGEREYVCSGWGEKSDWYKNIVVYPQVAIQVGWKTYCARARRVQEMDEFSKVTQEMFETGGDTHFESWLESYGIECNPQGMLEKRDRLYLVAFDPIDEAGPPPLPVDLKWVWWVILVIMAGVCWFVRR